MKAVVINNKLMEVECICESPENYVTKAFHKFVRSVMFNCAASSYTCKDLSAQVGRYEYKMLTNADGPNISADFYINDEFMRHMIIAE